MKRNNFFCHSSRRMQPGGLLATLPAFVALICALSLAPPTAAQSDARVLHRNIAQLVQKADVIFYGQVVSAEIEPHPQFTNLKTVLVTLKVREVLKGQPGETYTFRQYLSDLRDVRTRLNYRPGQQYVLLMLKPSQYGLSSPSGHEQGRFRVTKDAEGKAWVRNGMDNIRLMEKVDETAPNLKVGLDSATRTRIAQHHRGPILYDDLKNVIRGAVAAGN